MVERRVSFRAVLGRSYDLHFMPGLANRQTQLRKATDQQEGPPPTQSAASKAGCTVDREEPSSEPHGRDMLAGACACRTLLLYTTHSGVDW